jgi:hypothetical protein
MDERSTIKHKTLNRKAHAAIMAQNLTHPLMLLKDAALGSAYWMSTVPSLKAARVLTGFPKPTALPKVAFSADMICVVTGANRGSEYFAPPSLVTARLINRASCIVLKSVAAWLKLCPSG